MRHSSVHLASDLRVLSPGAMPGIFLSSPKLPETAEGGSRLPRAQESTCWLSVEAGEELSIGGYPATQYHAMLERAHLTGRASK